MLDKDESKCVVCGSPAAGGTERGDHVLCPGCAYDDELDAEWNREIARIAAAQRTGVDATFEILDQMLRRHADRDYRRRVEREVRVIRAQTLSMHGRHAEALAELVAVESMLVPDTDEFIENKLSIAGTLADLGRPAEALRELDRAVLACGRRLDDEVTMSFIGVYATIASSSGLQVPEAYRPYLENVVSGWEIPVADGLRRGPLTEAILAVKALRIEAQDRFVSTYERVRGMPRESARKVIDEYLRHEEFGYFRRMARRWLECERDG